MKYSILICLILINLSLFAQVEVNINSVDNKSQDSTLHQRFVVNILKEYDLEGRWIFIKVDSLYMLENNYELINPYNIYELYNDNFFGMNKERFLFMAYNTLQGEAFERYATDRHPIKGKKVDMKTYNILKEMPINKLLYTYFDNNKILKKEYYNDLFEIIAICYVNNIKVITPKNGPAHYEVFK